MPVRLAFRTVGLTNVQDNNDEPNERGPNDWGSSERGDGSPGDRSSPRRRAAERSAERAAEFFRRGRLAEAEAELRKALAVDPGRGELHFNLGLTLEAAGRLDDALRSFRDAVLRLPRRAETRLAEGSILCRLGRFEEAIQPLEAATTIERTSDPAWARLIEAKAGLGRFEEAETTYYVAQQNLERMPLSLVAMGDLQLATGRPPLAEWCFREALNQAPELHRVRGKLGRALAQGGSVDAGLRMYLEELRLHPGDVQTLIECGDLLATQHRIGEAIEKYRRAAELAPSLALPRARLGMILLAVGRAEHARAELEKAYALDPTTPLVRATLAAILVGEANDGEYAMDVDDAEQARPPQGESPATSAGPVGGETGEPARAKLLTSALRLLREEIAQRKDLLETSDEDDILRISEHLFDCGAAAEAMQLLERAAERGVGGGADTKNEAGVAAARESSRLAFRRRLMVLYFQSGHRRRGRGLARQIARENAVPVGDRGVGDRISPSRDTTVACEYNLTLDAIETGRLRLAFGRLRKAMAHHPHDPALRGLRARLWWVALTRLGGGRARSRSGLLATAAATCARAIARVIRSRDR